MSVPLVSILTPCHNSERWISETLESALNQTWPNKEIIVVDDGSSDRSPEIAGSFAPRGVKVIKQENSGASAARNRALLEAQGDYIQYLDADDLLAPDKIELQINRLAREEPGRIASCAWARFYDEPANGKFVVDSLWKDYSPVDWLVTSWTTGNMMATGAWLVPRAVADRAGSWDETRCPIDDAEYFTRVILSSNGISFCEEAREYYRSGIPNTLSKQSSREMLSATYRAIESCTRQLLAREDSQRTRRACASFFQRYIYDVYPRVPELVQEAEARVRTLGGSDMAYDGSTKIRLLTGLVGWKAAKRVHSFSYRLRSRFQSAGKS
ncbi:MAG TPA: glycosyltransferase family A protein [Pyrinomonadaceae bacterium]|jgi:glycosyltransferase involved in cell wall biosynthesis|nr:glycosyltransferase family A protein [Pyrinomonadaceae bacterium]